MKECFKRFLKNCELTEIKLVTRRFLRNAERRAGFDGVAEGLPRMRFGL